MNKNPLTTLISTSEGISYLLFLAMTVYGMITGEVSFVEGLVALGGGTGVWGTVRTVAKKDGSVKEQILEAIDEMKGAVQ